MWNLRRHILTYLLQEIELKIVVFLKIRGAVRIFRGSVLVSLLVLFFFVEATWEYGVYSMVVSSSPYWFSLPHFLFSKRKREVFFVFVTFF